MADHVTCTLSPRPLPVELTSSIVGRIFERQRKRGTRNAHKNAREWSEARKDADGSRPRVCDTLPHSTDAAMSISRNISLSTLRMNANVGLESSNWSNVIMVLA